MPTDIEDLRYRMLTYLRSADRPVSPAEFEGHFRDVPLGTLVRGFAHLVDRGFITVDEQQFIWVKDATT